MKNPFSIFFPSMSQSMTKRRTRLAVALVYFGMGLCFSSWASRIPDIKTYLGLNDALFGSILFAIPVGQLLMMPVSGRLVPASEAGRSSCWRSPCTV